MALCSSSCHQGVTTKGGCRFMYCLLNLAFAFAYGSVIHFLHNNSMAEVKNPIVQKLGQMRFLTIWSVHAHLITSVVGILAVITSSSKLARLRNALHHGISLPYGLFVAALFWGLFFIDRDLIFPLWMEKYFPPLMNHIAHTLVIFTPILNTLTLYHDFTSGSFNFLLTYSVSYMSFLLFLGFYVKHWVYPVFELLDNQQKIIFLIFVHVVVLSFYYFGYLLHSYRWKALISSQKKEQKKKVK